jgi:preprotein translocase subunit SecA
MIGKLFSFLDANKRQIDRIQKIVEQINNEAAKAGKISRGDFVKKTKEFKERIKKGASLESILPEVFAVGREAAWKAVGLRPYDTQLIAGVALFEGSIAEQKTGEGKTLSALLPLYLRALSGNSVHLVTVNDYLARVGAGWNGPTFNLLGVSVGVIVQEGKSFVTIRSM